MCRTCFSESLGELTHDSAFICPNLEELQAILTAAGHQMAKAAPSSHGYTTRGQTVICITVPEEREEARNL